MELNGGNVCFAASAAAAGRAAESDVTDYGAYIGFEQLLYSKQEKIINYENKFNTYVRMHEIAVIVHSHSRLSAGVARRISS